MQLQLGTKKTKTKKMSKMSAVAMKMQLGIEHGEFIAREIAKFLMYSKRPITPVELDGIQDIMIFTKPKIYDIFSGGEEYRRWKNRLMDFEVL